MNKTLNFIRSYFEAMVWIGALVLLAIMNPYSNEPSLCIFHQFGIESCPGCGLGHSISAAFRGQFTRSFEMHPLGMVTIGVLFARIIAVFRQNYKFQELKKVN